MVEKVNQEIAEKILEITKATLSDLRYKQRIKELDEKALESYREADLSKAYKIENMILSVMEELANTLQLRIKEHLGLEVNIWWVECPHEDIECDEWIDLKDPFSGEILITIDLDNEKIVSIGEPE